MFLLQRKDLHGTELLDFLESSAVSCVHAVRGALGVLLRHVRHVFLSQLTSWLLHGELLAEHDFFVQRGKREELQMTEVRVQPTRRIWSRVWP